MLTHYTKHKSVFAGSETASLLPPYNGDEGDVFQDEDVQSVTPTSAPVLFTYAPSEGKFDKLTKRLGKLRNKRLYHRLLIRRFFSDSSPFPLI